jgi:hypothetical protein
VKRLGASATSARGATTRGKGNRNTGRRRVEMPKLIDGGESIINRKDLFITNGCDIRREETLLELAETVTTGRDQHRSHISTEKVRTAIKLERERMNEGRVEGHVENGLISERGRSDVQIDEFAG